MQSVGLIQISPFVGPEAAPRGTAVHKAAALLAKGTLNWNSVDPAIFGRVEAIEKFLRLSKVKVIATEMRVASKRYRYAGTLDMLCEYKDTLAVVDYKPDIMGAVQYQLASYVAAYVEMHPGTAIPYRICIRARTDGTYRTELFSVQTQRRHFQVFLAAATVFRAKEQLYG